MSLERKLLYSLECESCGIISPSDVPKTAETINEPCSRCGGKMLCDNKVKPYCGLEKWINSDKMYGPLHMVVLDVNNNVVRTLECPNGFDMEKYLIDQLGKYSFTFESLVDSLMWKITVYNKDHKATFTNIAFYRQKNKK